MANGIPIILPSLTEPGQIERPVFATVRRCPELLAKLKAIQRATIAEVVAAKKAAIAAAAVDTATPEDLDTVAKNAADVSDALTDASSEVFAAIRAFVLCGFTGAGYSPEQAEKYADMVPADRLGELRYACQLGCGLLDFTKPQTGQN
jgi:hypothetical protein